MPTGRPPYSREPRARPWLTLLYVAIASWWFVYGTLAHELFALVLGAAYAMLAAVFLREQLRRRSQAHSLNSRAASYLSTSPPPPPPRAVPRRPGY